MVLNPDTKLPYIRINMALAGVNRFVKPVFVKHYMATRIENLLHFQMTVPVNGHRISTYVFKYLGMKALREEVVVYV